MDKFWRAERILRAECDSVRIYPVEAAPEEWLRRVHTDDYLSRLRTASLTREEIVRLGLPPNEALLTRSRLETAGTVAALWAALEDGIACNLAGGTHHAFPARGLGYCVLNDVAVAIRALHAIDPGKRVAVIDTDAHQGNGTNGIFQGDDRVFTFSIHVGRNYPAEKTAGSLDTELPRFVGGSDYLKRLDESLSAVQNAFRPEIVFWIAGADPHENDRFGQMRLTDADMARRDEMVLSWMLAQNAPAIVLYGGGYNRDRVHTARLHAETVMRAAAYSAAFRSTVSQT